MKNTPFSKNSLVLYKNSPARVMQVGDKLEIELDNGKTQKVRPKDIAALHPGPVQSAQNLHPPAGDIETAWELLAGETTTLAELAELIYNEFTPASAWATWQMVMDGLYFRGTLEAIQVRLPEDVKKTQAERTAKAEKKVQQAAFLDRVRTGKILAEDARRLVDVEALAQGLRDTSKVMRELGQPQNQENAHALLLKLGYWDYAVNPYPKRMNANTTSSVADLPGLPDEPRTDLTHLPAFAIDDAGSHDPDDAISLDGNRLWVHIADVAALILPNTPPDLEARARGSNLYLPEGTVTMLPSTATDLLALGLAEISPALSFAIDVSELSGTGAVKLIEIVPSWVQVQRLSYGQAETQLDNEPFCSLYRLAQMFAQRRQANNAIELNLPEVKVRVKDGQVVIRPLPPLKSRSLVREAMLMTGEAVAHFAQERNIPLLFSTQEAPDSGEGDFADTMAGMFARRRTMQRSQLKSAPIPHAGLGLEMYAQTTSPLRRYADLVSHQQLRAYLREKPLLTETDILERVGAAEAVTGNVRQAERLSNKHWTLVYLLQNPDWRGDGVLVEQLRGGRGRVLIPELDLETFLHLHKDPPLNSTLSLTLSNVNLPQLEAHFRVEQIIEAQRRIEG